MSTKLTIIEGNTNDKDNVRAIMVKGEPGSNGVSPTFETSKVGDTATITITDAEGTHEVELKDGYSPTVSASKTGKVTTVTMTDIVGTTTATINDGIDLTGGVPTNGVIAFDGNVADIPDGYEVSSSSLATLTNQYSTSNSIGYTANFINEYVDEQTSIVYSTTETLTNKVWIDNSPIYRMVAEVTSSSSDVTTWTNLVQVPNSKYLTYIGGFADTTNVIKAPLPRYESASYYVQFLLNNGYLQYRCVGYTGLKMYLIIEYTKTTD